MVAAEAALRRRRQAGIRYRIPWGSEFWAIVSERLEPGISVLDIGAGRRPTIAAAARPQGITYVGLDPAREELELAPPGSYDEIVAASAESDIAGLHDRFDLIVSWQALEHVENMRAVGANFHSYAKPNGAFVGLLSGRNAAYALANRLLPGPIGARLVARLRDRPLETVFPAHYDLCTADGLREAFAGWASVDVLALFHGADYFDRAAPLQRAYLRFENWAERSNRENLATHYVVSTRRGG